jgi:integrase
VKHLRQTGGGWQKHARIDGRFVSEYSKERPTAAEVKQWLRRQHGKAEAPPSDEANEAEPFEASVADYLESVTAMPSFADRQFHMQEWAAHFKGRDMATVKPIEIRTRLNLLRQTYSASSCNKRRTALMSFYTSINGKSGYNPVRDVVKFPEEAEPRAHSFLTIYRILALMRPSKTRARLRVILWTGWPHAQLQRLKPAHLDLVHNRAFVTPRRKGKGRQGTWLPLLDGAVAALKDFVSWDCFTPLHPKTGKPVPFSPSAMHSSFERAVAKLNARRARFGHPPLEIRPYDLRHCFGTMVAERITDERALQELLMHSRAEQTRRYTEAATQKRVAAAVAMIQDRKKSA